MKNRASDACGWHIRAKLKKRCNFEMDVDLPLEGAEPWNLIEMKFRQIENHFVQVLFGEFPYD